MFQLRKIKVYPGCKGRKNLKQEEYVLISEDASRLPDGFYGNNITVSSIVGKNGSGKSSILDIVYRVLNNLSAFLCTNLNTESYHAFYYIKGVRAEIIFSDSDGRHCKIKCLDDAMWLSFFDENGEEKRYRFGRSGLPVDDYRSMNSITELERAEILNHLFYCSVVNYAPFTLNSREYEKEPCAEVNDNLHVDFNDLPERNWMQAIFHKNDGYQSPITLTPYRDKGVFDASNEARLARERLLCLLSVDPELIDGYRFSNALFGVNQIRFAEKFRATNPTVENGFKPEMPFDQFLGVFKNRLEDSQAHRRDSVAARILRALGYSSETITLREPEYILAYLYLVYKVLSCARYPIFDKYADLNDPDLAIKGDEDKRLLDRITNLTKTILSEHSHITFKLERARNYIAKLDRLTNDDFASGLNFYLSDYFRVTGHDKDASLITATRDLPPSYFDMTMYLTPMDGKEDIKFEHLSSGERLFYVTISSIIYHAMNLISIPEHRDRVKYRNMLVVLDESEICFHPEYQRTFLNKLINVIKRLGFNRYINFHILLTTHSPFILSDIPLSNILFLRDGKSVNPAAEEIINPYGANINDILCQSFFLQDKGFIGEHARQTIVSLMKYLDPSSVEASEENDIRWNEESARTVIDTIGEPLIREGLLTLYRKKFRNKEELRRQIMRLNEELMQLEGED